MLTLLEVGSVNIGRGLEIEIQKFPTNIGYCAFKIGDSKKLLNIIN